MSLPAYDWAKPLLLSSAFWRAEADSDALVDFMKHLPDLLLALDVEHTASGRRDVAPAFALMYLSSLGGVAEI